MRPPGFVIWLLLAAVAVKSSGITGEAEEADSATAWAQESHPPHSERKIKDLEGQLAKQKDLLLRATDSKATAVGVVGVALKQLAVEMKHSERKGEGEREQIREDVKRDHNELVNKAKVDSRSTELSRCQNDRSALRKKLVSVTVAGAPDARALARLLAPAGPTGEDRSLGEANPASLAKLSSACKAFMKRRRGKQKKQPQNAASTRKSNFSGQQFPTKELRSRGNDTARHTTSSQRTRWGYTVGHMATKMQGPSP